MDLLSQPDQSDVCRAFERRAVRLIENRNLSVGTRLVARYKKQTYVCTVEAGESGEGIAFVLETGQRFKSPSAAGMHVMGGKAVNGWRFWSLEGDAPAASDAAKPAPKKGKAWLLIRRVPNQQGTPAGKTKFFCSACMKGFLVDEGEQPQVCPEGHRTDDPELTGRVGRPTGEEAQG
jgi:hypothetical protein